MKLLSVVFIFLIVASIHSSHCADGEADDGKTSLDEQWRKYKIEFKKSYGTDEDEMRFKLFKETLLQIDEHNMKFKKGLVEVEAGLNDYSDWTYEQKTKLLGVPA